MKITEHITKIINQIKGTKCIICYRQKTTYKTTCPGCTEQYCEQHILPESHGCFTITKPPAHINYHSNGTYSGDHY